MSRKKEIAKFANTIPKHELPQVSVLERSKQEIGPYGARKDCKALCNWLLRISSTLGKLTYFRMIWFILFGVGLISLRVKGSVQSKGLL